MKKAKPKKKVRVTKGSGTTRRAKPGKGYIGETEKNL
jgi:hypothetical protein